MKSSGLLKSCLILELKFSILLIFFCDNDSTIKLAQNPVFHERTKNFEVDVHFIRDFFKKKGS